MSFNKTHNKENSMKRIVMLVAALGVASSAYAADDSEIKNSGEFRLRYQNLMNNTGLKDAKDGAAGFTQRLKWNANVRKGENLQAFVGVLHNAAWGVFGGNFSNDNGGQPGTDEVIVSRAWGWWKTSDALSFKFGRQGMEIADGAVFSENDWEAVPVSLDGVVATWDMDFAKFNFFGLKIKDYIGGTGLSADPERNFYGVSADLKNMPEAIKMANLHVIQDNRDEVDALNARSSQRFGLTVGGDTMNILYKATLAYVIGEEKDRSTPGTETKADIDAMMYDLMVGYAMPDVMGLKITAGYHSDSGQKAGSTKIQKYDPLFYDRHNYAGLMDVFDWGNLTYITLAASVMPSDSVEAGIAGYLFSKTQSADTPSYARGGTWLSGSAGTADKDLGTEIDLWANKSYDNGFKIGARYGMFMPGKSFKNETPERKETAHELFLQASLNF